MNDSVQLVSRLIQKRLVFPKIALLQNLKSEGSSKTLARQIDAALMQVGFKLSKELLAYFGTLPAVDAFAAAHRLLSTARQLVGDHVQHNVYFKDFPKNVPDTFEFWGKLLADYYEQTGTITFNLLDFPSYGRYQHTYEEMVAAHDTFKPKKGAHPLKVINLGGTERDELIGLYVNLAGSVVPLNEEDRKLLEELFRAGFRDLKVAVPVRENKAIINSLWLEQGEALDVDTPLDVLRIAAHLSGGDVTLTENTRFKSLKRPARRALVAALDAVLAAAPEKIDDINSRREQFKRLAERLHPFEFAKAYPAAVRAFAFANGDLKVQTWGYKVHTAIQTGKLTKAVRLLSEKPGQLVRQMDKIAREATDAQFANLIETLAESTRNVSGRVLLSVVEHLDNRRDDLASRLFVNKAGRGFASPEKLVALPAKRVDRLQKALWKEIARRIPAKHDLQIDPLIETVAVPISEKSKSEGFRVLPRGSTFALDSAKPLLRFFVYWHQTSQRTDYDLSCAFYDRDFNYVDQISWTNISGRYSYDDYVGGRRSRGGNVESRNSYQLSAYHSGDIVDAPDGASEMIDIDLSTLDPRICYIIPTINAFGGEPFAKCKEAFLGFMSRDIAEKGKPYEPRTVETRFDLRGEENGVGIPMVFMRDSDGWAGKWLDLYSKGQPWGNRVEATKFSTALLAKTLISRRYLTVGRLLDLYREKARKVTKASDKRAKRLTYVGISQPEGLPAGTEVVTLDNLKSLIPA